MACIEWDDGVVNGQQAVSLLSTVVATANANKCHMLSELMLASNVRHCRWRGIQVVAPHVVVSQACSSCYLLRRMLLLSAAVHAAAAT